MAKKLEDLQIKNVTSIDISNIQAYKIKFIGENQCNNISSEEATNDKYLCDCDQWGGGEPPCDNCR